MEWLRKLIRRHYWRQDSIIFEATRRCNLHCGHCYNIWKVANTADAGELDTKRAVKLIRLACRDSRCTRFTFSGGEPCMRDDLEILVRAAKKRCGNVNLISNGTLLDDSRIRRLMKEGVDLFELPLNSAVPEIHDAMASRKGVFDKVVRAASGIRTAGAALVIVFVGTKANIDGWPDVLRLGTALGADAFLFNRYNAGGAGAADPAALLPAPEQVREALAFADSFAREKGVGVSASIAIPPCLVDTSLYGNVGFGYCTAGTANAYYTLDPLGNVRPCNHSSLVLGNIFRERLSVMARGGDMAGFRAALPEMCAPCRLARRCQGGCKAAAEQCYGSTSAAEPFLLMNAERRDARVMGGGDG